MKTALLVVLPALFACSSSRHMSVGEHAAKSDDKASCAQPCTAQVRCLPNGNCLITCSGPDGQPCEIELACDGDSCEVVRYEGGDCCESMRDCVSAAPRR